VNEQESGKIERRTQVINIRGKRKAKRLKKGEGSARDPPGVPPIALTSGVTEGEKTPDQELIENGF